MILDDHPQVLSYLRKHENQTLVVLNNYYAQETVVNMPTEVISHTTANVLISNYKDSAKLDAKITLRPYESIAYYIEE